MDDRSVVALQIGREPRSVVDVVARCQLGLPVVIKVPPHLDDGTPFPTTFWLTCPLARRRIGRIEAAGGVKAAELKISADPGLAAAFAEAMERYEAQRDALVDPDRSGHQPRGGVGGSRRGVKCLHAHYADHAAGNRNPVGADTAEIIEPLDCTIACTTETEGAVVLNPDWIEP
jgi:hypothetical protein